MFLLPFFPLLLICSSPLSSLLSPLSSLLSPPPVSPLSFLFFPPLPFLLLLLTNLCFSLSTLSWILWKSACCRYKTSNASWWMRRSVLNRRVRRREDERASKIYDISLVWEFVITRAEFKLDIGNPPATGNLSPLWKTNVQMRSKRPLVLLGLRAERRSWWHHTPRDQIFRPRWIVGSLIKKSPWSFARVVGRDHVNRVRNADQAARVCEQFVYSIVKITRLYDYQTRYVFWEKFTRCAKVCGLVFFLTAFRMQVGFKWLLHNCDEYQS